MIRIEAAKLLNSPTGNLIYHLILVVALTLLLVLSQDRWSRHRTSANLRWMIASGRLLFLHMAWTILESIALLSSVASNAFVSLSHSTSLFGVILLAWISLFPEPSRLGDRFALGAAK